MMVFSVNAPPLPFTPTPDDLIAVELVTPTPAKPGCPAGNPIFEARVMDLINAERAANGLGALSAEDRLIQAAQWHSADMACNNYFSHFAPDGSSGGDRITRAGYLWNYFGENIAAGYASPEKVVQAWMESPSHKANILNKNYVEIGVGYAYYADSAYGIYWTAVFGKP
jgi:uncharacterized protein YkwD